MIDELQQAGVDAVGFREAVYLGLRLSMRDRVFGPLLRHAPPALGRQLSKHLAARSQDRFVALRGFLLENSEAVVAILEALESRRNVDLRQDLALGWILELLWMYQIATVPGTSSSVLVMDEGFSNRAVTLFGYRFSPEDEPFLERYINAIPMPDLVVVVTKDVESAATLASDRIRFDQLNDAAIVQYTRDADVCVSAISRLLIERGVEVREVRNESSLAAASAEAREVIRAWLDRG